MATTTLPPITKPLRLLAELDGQIVGAIDAGEVTVPLTVDGDIERQGIAGVAIGFDVDAFREELHNALRRVVADLDAPEEAEEAPDGQ